MWPFLQGQLTKHNKFVRDLIREVKMLTSADQIWIWKQSDNFSRWLALLLMRGGPRSCWGECWSFDMLDPRWSTLGFSFEWPEIFRIGKEKRCLKFLKKRIGSHDLAKRWSPPNEKLFHLYFIFLGKEDMKKDRAVTKAMISVALSCKLNVT